MTVSILVYRKKSKYLSFLLFIVVGILPDCFMTTAVLPFYRSSMPAAAQSTVIFNGSRVTDSGHHLFLINIQYSTFA